MSEIQKAIESQAPRVKRMTHTGDTADLIDDEQGKLMTVEDHERELAAMRVALLAEIRSAAQYAGLFDGLYCSPAEGVEVAIMYAVNGSDAARALAECVQQAGGVTS